jgi:hypothetical protein
MPTLKEVDALKAKLKAARAENKSHGLHKDVSKVFREIATELRTARVGGAYSIDAVELVLTHLESSAAELES